MNIGPILSTLRRHKTAAALIVLEIMLACAILCNAIAPIVQRVQRIQRTTGWAESELLVIGLVGIGDDANADVLTREDLVALRALPYVKQVTTTNQFPYGNSSWNTGVNLAPDQQRATMNASQYLGGEHFLETTGVRVVAGRDFLPEEYLDESSTDDTTGRALPIIVNRPMAEQLFPHGDVLGKTLYSGNQPLKVVGVVDPFSAARQLEDSHPAMIFPQRMNFSRGGAYLIRTDPSHRAEVLKAAVAELQKVSSKRVVLRQATFDEIKDKFFAPDRATCWLLVGMCTALLIVTALGIVGLASFWVQQRARMIGTRRALGATRGQIRSYFQTENLLLTTMGIVLGMLAAYGVNQAMMTHYELTRLPLAYLPIGAVTLWVLGQIAVLGPALRAAALPPVAVMRAG